MKCNPLKMWGTYIGLLIGMVLGYFSFAIPFALCEFYNCSFIVIFIPFVVFFGCGMVGWCLHCLGRLIRERMKFKKHFFG